jgi:predicted enzyme related to lactoylglutathione lyase
MCAAPLHAAPPLPPINTPTSAPHISGSFVWFDLVTDDLNASAKFYGTVFGWSVRSAGPAYRVIRLGNRDIGGMLVPDGSRPASARWVALISVPDVNVAAKYTLRQGGKVLVPPFDAPQRGTHALLADPRGAVIGVLHSSTGDPPDAPVAVGDFFWADLFTPDPAKDALFYRDLVGYQLSDAPQDPNAPARVLLSAAGFARAGVAALPQPELRPGWLPYVLVDDVPGAVRRTLASGGQVRLAPSPGLLDGRLAVIADPRGALIGIVDWREPSGNVR